MTDSRTTAPETLGLSNNELICRAVRAARV
jgi:hypothetical protein